MASANVGKKDEHDDDPPHTDNAGDRGDGCHRPRRRLEDPSSFMVGTDLDESRRLRRVSRYDDPVRRVPVDQQGLRIERVDDVVGTQRVHHRLCSLADPVRPPRRSNRSPAYVPGGRDRVHDGVDAVRPRSERRRADRGACAPSRRSSGTCSGIAGARAADLSPPQDPGRGRDLGRDRRGRGCGGSDTGRTRRRAFRLEVGVLHQSAGRHRLVHARPPGAA